MPVAASDECKAEARNTDISSLTVAKQLNLSYTCPKHVFPKAWSLLLCCLKTVALLVFIFFPGTPLKYVAAVHVKRKTFYCHAACVRFPSQMHQFAGRASYALKQLTLP